MSRRVAAVVLAAGGSSRFGRAKQLVDYEGAPLVVRAARAALGAGASPVFVVVGAESARVREALAELPVTVVENAAWASGLASSLAAGVRAALDHVNVDGVLVTLADQPRVDAAALAALLRAWVPNGVAAARYGDVLGAPALFARAHAESLLTLEGDAGAGRWLRARAATVGDVVAVPMDAAALDVDTPADLARHDGGA